MFLCFYQETILKEVIFEKRKLENKCNSIQRNYKLEVQFLYSHEKKRFNLQQWKKLLIIVLYYINFF